MIWQGCKHELGSVRSKKQKQKTKRNLVLDYIQG